MAPPPAGGERGGGRAGRRAGRTDRAVREQYPDLAEVARGWRRAGTEAAQVSPDALTGRRITWQRCYGPAFDVATGVLGKRATSGWKMISARGGFVAALLNPPYGLRPAQAGYGDERELFSDVITDILDTPGTATFIWH